MTQKVGRQQTAGFNSIAFFGIESGTNTNVTVTADGKYRIEATGSLGLLDNSVTPTKMAKAAPHRVMETDGDGNPVWVDARTRLKSDASGIAGAIKFDNAIAMTEDTFTAQTPHPAGQLCLVIGPVGKWYLGDTLIMTGETTGIETLPGGDPDEPTSRDVWGDMDITHFTGTPPARGRSFDAVFTPDFTLNIAPGTTVASIKTQIAAVPLNQKLRVAFGEGDHFFTEKLLITRGDIDVCGAGKDKTTFVHSHPLGSIDNCVEILGPSIRSNDPGSNNGRWRKDKSTYIGDAAAAFAFGATQITVTSTAGLAPNDIIMIHKEYVSTGDKEELSSLAEIQSINSNVLTLKHKIAFASTHVTVDQSEPLSSIKIYKTTLLENVNVRDFSIRYNIPLESADNPFGYTLQQMLNTRENNFFKNYAAKDGPRPYIGTLQYGHHRALTISGTHEANVKNIELYNIGSNGFFFSGNLEMEADNLIVDECYNKGVASNGYGIEYDKIYYCNFTNGWVRGSRHGLTANQLSGAGFNNFHLLRTEANSDFHGGRDQGNIYYVEEAVMEAYWMPVTTQPNGAGDITNEIDFAIGKHAFTPMTYREPQWNEDENIVKFKSLISATGTLQGGIWLDAQGEKINSSFGNSNDDKIYAADDGANINAGFGSDTIVGGLGNDTINMGVGDNFDDDNTDTFVIRANSGDDIITTFEPDRDILEVEENANGSTFETPADVLAAASQVGSDVVINLGGGHSATLQNVTLGSLTTANFVIAP